MFDNLIKNWTSQSNEFLVSWKFTYIEGVFITNTKLKRVQLSLFHSFLLLTDFSFWNQSPSLIIQVSVKTLYFSYSTTRKEPRKESFSRPHFETSKLVLCFGFIWFLTNFRLWSWATEIRPWSSSWIISVSNSNG